MNIYSFKGNMKSAVTAALDSVFVKTQDSLARLEVSYLKQCIITEKQ